MIIPVTQRRSFVGLVARRMNDAQPKYINSMFVKSEVLFARDRLPMPADAILLVEGPLDAIWCQMAGIPAVASFGTSVTAAQISDLKCRELVVGFDADEAGTQAILRLMRQPPPLVVSVLTYPQGCKDPNDCTPDQLWQQWHARTPYLNWRISYVGSQSNPAAHQ